MRFVSTFAWSGHQEIPTDAVPPPISEIELFGASRSALSSEYRCQQALSCLRLLMQFTVCALALARASTGRSREARMAIMAMTTSSSIRVKALETGRADRSCQRSVAGSTPAMARNLIFMTFVISQDRNKHHISRPHPNPLQKFELRQGGESARPLLCQSEA